MFTVFGLGLEAAGSEFQCFYWIRWNDSTDKPSMVVPCHILVVNQTCLSFNVVMISSVKVLLCVGLIPVVCGVASAHPADENPPLTLPAVTSEFRYDRLGLAIHWGIYSTLSDGQGVMTDPDIAAADYAATARFFNPADFDASEWVALAKTMGARYLAIDAKARDGFAMWDSNAGDFNIMDRTPFKQDIVKAVVEECHRKEVKPHLFYSPLDRYMSEQFGRPGTALSDDENTTVAVDYTRAQLTEILTKYSTINGLRLGPWSKTPDAETALQQTYQLIHGIQFNTMIGTDHGGNPLNNESFQIINGGPAAFRPSVDGNALEYNSVPVEVSDTVNNSRGYSIVDRDYKSARELVHNLVRAAGADANYLLHVGAMPNGKIPQEIRNRLTLLGMWLARHGESVYSTRGGPMAPQPWGVTMHRGRKIYVHVLDPDVNSVEVELPMEFRTARYFPDERIVDYDLITSKTVRLNLRPENRDELERIIQIQTKNYQR